MSDIDCTECGCAADIDDDDEGFWIDDTGPLCLGCYDKAIDGNNTQGG